MSCERIESVQCWKVRMESDWALIVVSNDTGLVSITSSYGDYNYLWHPAHVGGRTVLEFLIGLNFDYAMGKFLGMKTHFNAETTIKYYKEQIIEDRQRLDISAESAREYWDELEDIEAETHTSDAAFCEVVSHTEYADHNQCWWECLSMSHPPQARMFWDRMWPEFKKAVAEELSSQTTKEQK